MRFSIRNGLDLEPARAPVPVIDRVGDTQRVSLLGCDYPGNRLRALIDKGTRVRAGEAVLCDRRLPEIVITSPLAGTVSAVVLGPRRRLISMEIVADGGDEISFDIPSTPDRKQVRELMLRSGLWAAIRSRPFDDIPVPGKEPRALLVTAIDTHPLSPNPALIIDSFRDEFCAGLELLCTAVDAPVYLCRSARDGLDLGLLPGVIPAIFSGPHPAGLAGTHIQALGLAVDMDNPVWHIGYQDVIALGRLFRSGSPWQQRVISLAGSAVADPRLLTVGLGAALGDIVDGEISGETARVFSGSLLSGRVEADYRRCLGRWHCQVTAMHETGPDTPLSGLAGFFDWRDTRGRGPLIATPDLDQVAPPGMLAVPLLKALMVGDIERACELGALELAEEDLALPSYVCASGQDYGLLLRQALNRVAREGLGL